VAGVDSVRLQLSRRQSERILSARHNPQGLHILSTASSVGIKNILLVDIPCTHQTPSNSRRLVGVDWDHRTQKRAIYQIVGKGHKGWSPNVDNEFGNYDYLLGADVRPVRHVVNQGRLTQL
jgi:hypothetical protein